MNLQEILQREPEFREVYERLDSVPHKAGEAKNKFAAKLEDVIPTLYESPEIFRLSTSILKARLDILERKKVLDELDCPSADQTAIGEITYFLSISKSNQQNYNNPDYLTMLRVGEQCIRNHALLPSHDKDIMTIVNMYLRESQNLQYIISLLPDSQKHHADSIRNYFLNAGSLVGGFGIGELMFTYYGGLAKTIIMAKEEGYEEQLGHMLGLMGKIRHNGSIGWRISAGGIMDNEFIGTCTQLKNVGKLPYYAEVAKRLEHVACINPTNLEIITKGRLPKIIEAYEKAGLSDRFFEILDRAVDMHKDDEAVPLEKMIPFGFMGMGFHLFENFPELYSKYGEESFDIFSKVHQKLGDDIPWGSVTKAVDLFYTSGLSERMTLDEWLDKANMAVDMMKTPIHKSGILPVTIDMLAKGDYDHFLECLPEITFWNHISKRGDGRLELYESTREYLSYLTVVDQLPNLPEGKIDAKWLKEVQKLVGLSDTEFNHWIKTVSAEVRAVAEMVEKDGDKYRNQFGILIGDNSFVKRVSDINHYRHNLPIMLENGIDLIVAYELRDTLTWLDGFDPPDMGSVKTIVNSNAGIDYKRKLLRCCEALKKVQGIPKVTSIDTWEEEIAKYTKLSKERCTKWLDGLALRKGILPESYAKAIPHMMDNGISIDEALFLWAPSFLRRLGHEDLIPLREVINIDAPLEDKMNFLFKVEDYRYLLEFVHPENLDFEAWKKEAEEKAAKYFDDHGVRLLYPKDFTLTLLRSTKGTSREDLLKLAQFEAEGESTKTSFPLGKVYGTQSVYGLARAADPVDATRLLVYGLISRRPERVLQAYEFFSPEKLDKARSFIEKSHKPPTRLFNDISPRLNEINTNPDYGRRRHMGSNIIGTIKAVYLDSSSDSEGKTELRELVWLVESLYEGNEVFDAITAKMQDGTLYDLADGKRLLCCAMVSEDRERTEIESIYYGLDPNIALMHIVPSLDGKYRMPVGAAILANTIDRDGNRVLLVDSLEGGELFERIKRDIAFGLATTGIAGVAEDTCAEYVCFNTAVPNTTAKRYVDFIGHLTETDEEPTYLMKIRGNQVVERRKRLLEAFKDKEALAGHVEGHIVPTEQLAGVLQPA